LQAVLDRPEDDAPRLVYADWLEETRQPVHVARAQLIRVQIALERLPETAPEWPQLAVRERKLLRRYWKTWQRPSRECKQQYERKYPAGLRGWRRKVVQIGSPVFAMPRWWFARGFIEEVEAVIWSGGTFELEADFPLRRAAFFLGGARHTLPQLRCNPRLDRLEWLLLYNFATSSDRDIHFAPPRHLVDSAVAAGLTVCELHLPWLPVRRLRRLLPLTRPPLFRRRPPRLQELDRRSRRLYRSDPIWRYVRRSDLRQILETLASPAWQRIVRQRPAWKYSRPEVVRRWYGLFLGDALREANAWAVSFEECPTRASAHVTCYVLFKPETARPAGMDRLRESPWFHAEHR
jgi:uncharacterized protein (TIGR02996 family)